MAGFKKGTREMPEMNTSSLPDLIFTILFFFMIVTTMREVTLNVKITVPAGTELEKLEKKSAVSFIYVGPPTDQYRAKYGSKPRMQLNNSFADPSMIKDFIAQERQSMEDQAAQVVSMKIDRDTKMSLINEIKAQLRQSWALKINYSAGSRGSGPKQ
ncbi:MAG: biopolymer transporter ExbD [Bacteroidaceae bacterium]|nr:biopolymer transporter ExbD [Bacteroidaceae bacterium]